MNTKETLEELVKARKGYKYLHQNRISPYQNYKYIFRKGKIFYCNNLDTNISNDCGAGWNLATFDWILNETNILDKIIVEFSIPSEATLIVPENSNGKFRTDIIKYEKQHKIGTIFPEIINILDKLKKYKPSNPITAEKMPNKKRLKIFIKKVRDQVRNQVEDQVWNQVWDQVRDQAWNQVWDQVRDQVRNQVEDQVWNQVWDQVRDQVWNQVEDQVWNQVRNQVWNQVWNQVEDQVWNQVWDQARDQVWNQVEDQARDQVWNQVEDQVWNQVRLYAYYAIKLFMNLKCEHPAFDLIRIGIIVVNILNKFKIFGKNGKFLGEIDDNF